MIRKINIRFLIFIAAAFCITASTFADYSWDSLEVGDFQWSPEIGLWSSADSSHPSGRVHNSRFNAGNLLLAARYGLLDDSRIESVLEALSDMQYSHGAIKVAYEHDSVEDGNSAFFVCRKLVLLMKEYESELSANSINILETMFSRFYNRFYNQSMNLSSARYANRYLGDLTLARLLQEMYPPEDASKETDVNTKMLETTEYWRDNNWGWGEHLSDIYAGTCMDLISQYLLFTNDTSNQIYDEYTDLLNELLYIEDRFGGNPRVPAIRSYAFTSRGPRTHYRDGIREWEPSMAQTSNHHWRAGSLISAIFYENNWQSLPAPRADTASYIQIDCYDQAIATAIIKDDIRLGSISNYPIMDGIEHSTWGLLWQSMPVAMWKPDGDWGFLQWRTVEDGQTRAHPVDSRGDDVQLTDDFDPPLYGKTYSYQQGANILVVRLMPAITENWTAMSDVFKLINDTASVSQSPIGDNFRQLLLSYPQRTVSVGFSALTPKANNYFTYIGNALYWGTTYSQQQLDQADSAMHLWSLSLDGAITTAPEIEIIEDAQRSESEQIREVVFTWQNGDIWHAVIDPLSENVLAVTTDYVEFDGGEGSPEDPWQISNEKQLMRLDEDLTASYILNADINLTEPLEDSLIAAGQTTDNTFTGTFDGNGFTISNLEINGGSKNNIALFGHLADGGIVKNLKLEDVNISGTNSVGAIAGRSGGSIINCSVSGQSTISGNQFVGAIVGISLNSSQIDQSYAKAFVQASHSRVGGLVGQNSGNITDSFAEGDVDCLSSGWNQSGGLVGWNEAGTISRCYALGNVTGNGERIGGLVGQLNGGEIIDSYAKGNVSHTGSADGNINVGGLVGQASSNITRSFAAGDVDGAGGQRIGGLAGYSSGVISNCYATGAVSGSNTVGGLVGISLAEIANSYSTGQVTSEGTAGGFLGTRHTGGPVNGFWNTQTSSLTTGVGSGGTGGGTVSGKTTQQMKTIETFTDAGWDFEDVWFMPIHTTEEVEGYPIFNWQVDFHPADFNKDGIVNIEDLKIFIEYWLKAY